MFNSSIKSAPFFHFMIKSVFISTGDDNDYSEELRSATETSLLVC